MSLFLHNTKQARAVILNCGASGFSLSHHRLLKNAAVHMLHILRSLLLVIVLLSLEELCKLSATQEVPPIFRARWTLPEYGS